MQWPHHNDHEIVQRPQDHAVATRPCSGHKTMQWPQDHAMATMPCSGHETMQWPQDYVRATGLYNDHNTMQWPHDSAMTTRPCGGRITLATRPCDGHITMASTPLAWGHRSCHPVNSRRRSISRSREASVGVPVLCRISLPSFADVKAMSGGMGTAEGG